ncbi:MAG: ATP-dependent DNA helicase, partial [Rhizomicrobium sp.]
MTNEPAARLEFPALIPAPGGAVIADAHGAVARVGLDEARRLFRSGDVLVAHALFVSGRLKAPPARPLFDAMELFAFVRPAVPCVPSALGLARACGLLPPQTPDDSAKALHDVANILLHELRNKPERERAQIRALASALEKSGWRWAPFILESVGKPETALSPIAGFDAWRGLPQWEDEPAPDKTGSLPVDAGEARQRLARLVGEDGEVRTEQESYAEDATFAFGARERAGAPRIALIEAGTGTGKTLGYLAPASVWAEKNGPGLWLSTYTRNLQRQIIQELARLYPDPVERDDKCVVRKGRENYLCLLNFEEAAKRTAQAPGQRTVALGLIARWVRATRDGDMSGVGFPAFLASSIPLGEITDRRGECVYAACPHYRSCFIERVIRRSKNAEIVVANHALVIAQAAGESASVDETTDQPAERRVRYVFDEGHHLFDAADSGFAAFLSGVEMADLRRWIRGPEGRARTRMRGLEERLKDIIGDDVVARETLDDCVAAASTLTSEGWLSRLHNGSPRGPGEVFLAAAYQHVKARSANEDAFYSLEADTEPLSEELLEAARGLGIGLARLSQPLLSLAYRLRKKITEQAKELETYQRARIEAAARGLEKRARIIVPEWIAMLSSLENGDRREEFVDWFEIEREDGRDYDIGLWRHW